MKLNDSIIRNNFHRKKLKRYHNDKNSLVINELGLNHGKNRADIAVVNGHMIGYEIKSDYDSLDRLEKQIKSYNEIFDKINVIVGLRHFNNIHKYLPEWWGIITVETSSNNKVKFNLVRKPIKNKNIVPISIARLLWRDEVIQLLMQKNVSPKILRLPRSYLYETLANSMSISELSRSVRYGLRIRKNWRFPEPPSSYDGLSQPSSK